MAVENYFLSRDGRTQINKICSFLESLVIKINAEGDQYETKDSYLKWIKYKGAYEGNDDIYNYDYTFEDIQNSGVHSADAANKGLISKDKVFKLYLNNDPDAILLLKYLRKQYIENYVELNDYYRQFLGLPKKGEEIFIINKDRTSPTEPENLPIEKINITEYPLTYEYLYMEGLISKIKSIHPDYVYLNFIQYPITLYRARSCSQFSILFYNNSILTDMEIFNFINVYEKTKTYIDKMMYVYGFDSRMPMYPYLMEVLLLQGTMTSFFNLYMENYALGNYSDQEIFDILDSYNLSSLKSVNINTLRKIIKDIPDLIELKGSDKVIDKILEVVANNSITIKRYYLTKSFPTDSTGGIAIDTTKTYEDNVNVKFKEKIIIAGEGTKTTGDGLYDYHAFIEDDTTWGGDTKNISKDEEFKIKERFRKEILQMDFSSILTKYLSISTSIDSYAKQVGVHNMLGLIWQFCQRKPNDNFLVNDTLDFYSYTIRPLDLYAALCWVTAYINGVTNPDNINVKNMAIEGILTIRRIDGISSILNDIKSGQATVKLPAGLGAKTVREIFGDDFEYEKYLTYFNSETNLSDIMSNYEKNIKIINEIKEKWISSASLEECLVWEFLLEQNQTNKTYQILFDSYERFSEFISENNIEFGKYLDLTINNDDFNIDIAYTLLMDILDVFRKYMSDKTNEWLILRGSESDQESSAPYLNDLVILFNEFLSIYTELHKIEYSQVLSDYPYNKLRLLYHNFKESFDSSASEKTYIEFSKMIDTFNNKIDFSVNSLFEDIDNLIIEPKRTTILLEYLKGYEQLAESYNLVNNVSFNTQKDTFYENFEDSLSLNEKILEE